MIFQRRSKVTLLFLIVLLSALSVILLGILQTRWLNRLYEADETRLRRSLEDSVDNIFTAARDEVYILNALFNLRPVELEAQNWERFAEAYEIWRSSTRFEALISAIYLFAEDSSGVNAFEYRADLPGFVPSVEASELLDAEDVPDLRQLFLKSRPAELSLHQGEYLLIPIIGLPGEEAIPWNRRDTDGEQEGPRLEDAKPEEGMKIHGLVMIRIENEVFFREVVPYYAEHYLPDYPFQVLKNDTGRIIAASAEPPGASQPELSVPLRGVSTNWRYRAETADEQRKPDGSMTTLLERYQLEDFAIRFWLQRRQAREVHPPPNEEEMSPAAYTFAVYYPDGPLDAVMRGRLWTNMGVSIGVLLLLLASVFFLLWIYRSTSRIREQEQDFVASMSHELRTPLAVLQSTSENLIAGVVKDSERLERYGSIIHRETKRLSRMVEGILLYSGLENRSWNGTHTASVNLRKLTEEVVESLRETASEAEAVISMNQNVPEYPVLSDPTGLRLILENLITNAIRHGLPGQAPRARSSPGQDRAEIRLLVESQLYGRRLRIRVEDDGAGISEKESRRIFEPFVRGEASVETLRPGSGLGLHLIRRVVKILGGTVDLESPYEDMAGILHRGCRFTVELPLEQETGDERKNSDR